MGTDIGAFGSQGVTGSDNACDITEDYHDTGAEGCTYVCSGDVPITRVVYLPLVVRD